ncbi:universal stress protein [Streptomyces aidingensis]|uniref:Nucleotide-binding universal stress protein, UspA family n=1 Tax=Streptomyces aidingensis TaxID=910347 RepID=A0A1I1SSP4_9ACTN|nr:universal stress protein [Streptomyces aidingensis]SFD46070.1 Nucleotide-binding universal stress protein, UspA family [Streptomyces aidingensis]
MAGAVAAGVDGSRESRAAADWAAREAVRREVPLRLVNCWGLASPLASLRAGAEPAGSLRLLGGVRLELLAGYPGLEIETESRTGGPVHALTEAAGAAELLVLGSRGLGQLTGFLLGSVSLPVVARAGRPVVVVRPEGNWTEASGLAVVVGVGRPDPEVLDFAFRAAAVRGLGLRAVRVTPREDGRPAPGELASVLRPLRDAYPDTRVAEEAVTGSPGQVLTEAAASAELVVVGRGGHRSGFGPRVGPVVHALLHHAPCPVAVVPPAEG